MNCSNNQLTSLDVSGETSLERLYCQNNSLTSLIVRATPVLTRIDCSGNKLQGSLDVTEAPKLSILECYDNNLESVKYVSRLLRVEGDRDIQIFLIEENPGPGYYDDDEYDDSSLSIIIAVYQIPD